MFSAPREGSLLYRWLYALGLLLSVAWALPSVTQAGEVKLEETFFYHGNINPYAYFPGSIDVDADGTVAVAITPTVGEMSVPRTQQGTVLLFDKKGELIGQIESPSSTMHDVAFGPDHRVYTVEGWFGSGEHVYDRPGATPRSIPSRAFRADGSDVDAGTASGLAVGPDFRIYSLRKGKLYVTSPENKLIKALDCPAGMKVDVGTDGTVYVGNRALGKDEKWKDLPYTVRDIAPDGKLLAVKGGQWGIYDPRLGTLEQEVTLPPGNWHDAALGPDGNVYLVPLADSELAYVVADVRGKILLRRGADFDRLTVQLNADDWTAGAEVPIRAEVVRARDLGYVPTSIQLPLDNRPKLGPRAFLAPAVHDPLGEPAWAECPLEAAGEGKYLLKVPGNLHGRYRLRFTARPAIPGLRFLEIETTVIVRPAGTKAFLALATDRNRTGFAPGGAVRLTAAAEAEKDVDLSGVGLVLARDGRAVWRVSLGLRFLAAKERATGVVVIPGEVTRLLRPGTYAATCDNLPQGVGAGAVVVGVGDPVRPSDFETLFHVLVGGVGPDAAAKAKLHAEMGATHVINAPFGGGGAGGNTEETLDAAERLGLTYSAQVFYHFAALNSLPQEQGAVRQWLGLTAQRFQTYPAFRGFNYHDLYAEFGMGGDAPRKELYPPLWREWGAPIAVPQSVPPAKRAIYTEAVGRSLTLPRLYEGWGQAIRHSAPRLERTTMQWWHLQGLDIADPDKVAAYQDAISTQHMEEQYYHPVTVANQVDLWRRPGLPLYCYGNASIHEDGTGAQMYREVMAGLSRGVQGFGRNELPQPGTASTELVHRTIAPAFHLLHRYGGLSASGEPEDQVALWRSFAQEALEPPDQVFSARRHHLLVAAAYTACLYAHRPATIVTDEGVLAGGLKKFKAVIISCEARPPDTLAAKLAEFLEDGGLVLANRPTDSAWLPRGAVDLGPLFTESHASYLNNQDLRRWLDMQAAEGDTQAKKLREAMGTRVRPLADCDDPDVWISTLKSGEARTIFITNLKLLPHRPEDLHRFTAYENTALPARPALQLEPGPYAVYNVLAGKLVRPLTKGDHWLVPLDLSVFPGAILALLPGEIADVKLQAGQAADRGQVEIEAAALDAKGEPIDAAVPFEVTVTTPGGERRYHFYRTARHGRLREAVPVAANDVAGPWTITVRELFGGRQRAGKLDVRLPELPAASPVPEVEWYAADRVKRALAEARTVALVVGEKQDEPLRPAITSLTRLLTEQGKRVVAVSAKDYLADRERFGWDKFELARYHAEVRLRPARYDLIVTLDTPDLPGGVIPWQAAPIPLTLTDPGPGRGLVQFLAMPVYDTEDAVSIAGGDGAGLRQAADSLAAPPEPAEPAPAPKTPVAPLEGAAGQEAPGPLRDLFGVPAAEVAASGDGERVAVGLKGWGNNFFVLDGSGRVLSKDVGGEWFPAHLQALDAGFAVLVHENDPTTLYLQLYDRDGKALVRLAAPGRRIGATGTTSIGHPLRVAEALAQASFSVTPDMKYAGVGGSKAIAVWDVRRKALLWRDDTVRFREGEFPQLRLSPDGSSLAVRYDGTLSSRDARQGKVARKTDLPFGAGGGTVQVNDGHAVVVGDDDLLGYRDGDLRWRWKAAKEVTARAFGGDGIHYAVGEPDGTVRILEGGGQVGGYVAPGGGVLSLQMLPDGSRVAFGTSTGWVGVLRADGTLVWKADVGSRAAVSFAGPDGDTVVGDWRGQVRRFDAAGKCRWTVDLTPQAYRGDLADVLTKPDPTPTLRLPAPDGPRPRAPEHRNNLAPRSEIRFVPAKIANTWDVDMESGHADLRYLTNGKADDRSTPWFTPYDVSRLMGYVDYENPVAVELRWKQPVALDTLVVREHSKHPEAVPEDVSVEAWIAEGVGTAGHWKELSHDLWNRGVVHVHNFKKVVTTKLRYRIHGDLGNNLWTTEVEVYGP